jgi:hypothetical protein
VNVGSRRDNLVRGRPILWLFSYASTSLEVLGDITKSNTYGHETRIVLHIVDGSIRIRNVPSTQEALKQASAFVRENVNK